MSCRHCHTRKANNRRGLCNKCYHDLAIRELYPVVKTVYAKRVDEPSLPLEDRLEREYSKSPLWRPAEFPPDDPRYNELVKARERAGLPVRHPGDAQPDLR